MTSVPVAWPVSLKQVAAAAFALCCACSTPLGQLRKELDPRASEELECPTSELRYVELARFISTTKVKVTGCGRQRAYQLQEGAWRKAADDKSELTVTPPGQ